jgi:hypothetical protein
MVGSALDMCKSDRVDSAEYTSSHKSLIVTMKDGSEWFVTAQRRKEGNGKEEE